MKILIISVKHSGENILADKMLYDYPRSTLKERGDGLIIDHLIYSKLGDLMDLAEEADIVVIPIRHPKVVAKLWLDNGEEITNDYFQMWEAISNFEEMDNVVFLPMDTDDLSERLEAVDLKVKQRQVISQSEKAELAIRAYQIVYEELFEVIGHIETSRGISPLMKPVGDKVQSLTDDVQVFLDRVYGYDTDEKPTKAANEKKRKAIKKRAPKNHWKHHCPVSDEQVFTPNGEVCSVCGGEA